MTELELTSAESEAASLESGFQGIGTLTEGSLHAGLKQYYKAPGDSFEVKVGTHHIDIVRDDLLIEIQTVNFSAMKKKLRTLLKAHSVLLLHPIPHKKWIVREDAGGERQSRRKSPKTGTVLQLFEELIRIPHLLDHPRLSIGALMIHENEILRDDGKGSRRRKRWSRRDRELIDVVREEYFEDPTDFLRLLPPTLPEPFSAKQLARLAKVKIKLARCITYTLRRCGALEMVGKDGNTLLYSPV